MRHKRRSPGRTRGPQSLVDALFARQTGTLSDTTFRASVYTSIVPSSTFINVSDVPNVTFRRFTPCGRYLVTLSNNLRDLIVYTVETGARRRLPQPSSASSSDVFDCVAHPPISTLPALTQPHLIPSQANLLSAPPLIPPHGHNRLMHIPGLLAQIPIPLIAPPFQAMSQMLPIGAPPQPSYPPLPPHAPPLLPPIVPSRLANKFSCPFSRFFSKKYEVPIAVGGDTLVLDFCLSTPSASHLILATVHRRDDDTDGADGAPAAPAPAASARPPALASTPVQTTFTLHLVSIATGRVADRYTLHEDYVPADAHAGVHMRGDFLAILSVRFQNVHLLRVREHPLPRFCFEGAVGYHCRPDDRPVLDAAREVETAWRRRTRAAGRCAARSDARGDRTSALRRPRHGSGVAGGDGDDDNDDDDDDDDDDDGGDDEAGDSGDDGDGQNGDAANGDDDGAQLGARNRAGAETGLGNGKVRGRFYSGLMQRLLVYVYRRYLREGKQNLFYRVVGQYSLLLMQKVQLLDNEHLLIRLGSFDRGGEPADAVTNTCFFVVYCIATTQIINLYDNRSSELAALYDTRRDEFIGDVAVAASLPAMSGDRHSAGANGRLSLLGGRQYSRTTPEKRIRTTLASLPCTSQHRNASVYLDRSVFSYNAELLSALDGTRAVALREVKWFKFRSVRTGTMSFKLAAGMLLSNRADDEAGGGQGAGASVWAGRLKMMCLFHPSLPLALSMEQGPSVGLRINFHVYGHHH